MPESQKITPYLWFDQQAQAAVELYTAVFPDSRIHNIQYQGDKPLLISFALSGQLFTALNGGPQFQFNPSISFYVVCESEEEIDQAWKKLSEGGKSLMELSTYPWSKKYGWLDDQFGVSWQLTLGKIAEVGQKISPVLMYTGEQAGRAESAIKLYTEIFEDSKVNLTARYEEGESEKDLGAIKHAQFELNGYLFIAMDSSVMHGVAFNEAISFVVNCDGQAEVDHFWNKLIADGGQEMRCAWLKDKFGVAWQIVPHTLKRLLADPDPQRAKRALDAMMSMQKIDIDMLERAAAGDL